jgi:hypothetical protein
VAEMKGRTRVSMRLMNEVDSEGKMRARDERSGIEGWGSRYSLVHYIRFRYRVLSPFQNKYTLCF